MSDNNNVIKKLEQRITRLEDIINKGLADDAKSQDSYNRIRENINNLTKNLDDVKINVEEVNNVKHQIFTTLGFFFGIFTLITINIGVTKSIFSSIECIANLYFSFACLLLLVFIQIFFCSYLHKYLLIPFLSKGNISYNTNSTNQKIFGFLLKFKYVILFIVVILGGLLYGYWYMYNSNSNYQKENANLKKEISDLKLSISIPKNDDYLFIKKLLNY